MSAPLQQVSGLAIATANGLLVKGGSEARHTNRCLHQLVQEALQIHNCQNAVILVGHKCFASIPSSSSFSSFSSSSSSSSLSSCQVDGREEVSELLALEGKIDLVIPRGSGDLVRSIQEQARGRIPVLGHSEGICNVYIDAQADPKKALKIG